METLYLSKRNLLTLLSKVERFEEGDQTACALVKYSNPTDPYSCTVDEIMVVAIPDEKYYTQRKAGPVHPKDDPGDEHGLKEVDIIL